MNYVKCTTSVLSLLASLCCLALLLLSNVGTLDTSSIRESDYLMRLDMNGLFLEYLLPQYNGREKAEYGFADVYFFGMYGYCSVYYDDSAFINYNNTVQVQQDIIGECFSSSKYELDILSFVEYQIDNYNTIGLNLDTTEIVLPGSLSQNAERTKHVSRIIYIFSIIAIVSCFLSIVAQLIYLFSWNDYVIMCGLQVLTFCSSLISSAAALGTYKYVADQINTYDWTSNMKSATLSTEFMVFTWLATALAFLGVALMVVVKLVDRRYYVIDKPAEVSKMQGVC